jgi:hypothetical protein
MRPRIGREIDRGAEGVVYENLDEADWVIKEFYQMGVSPLQARNEYENLEKARAIRPDNVARARAPADPRQGWIVKEKVTPSTAPEDSAQKDDLRQALRNIPDVDGNLIWGTTASNPTPRWILIE